MMNSMSISRRNFLGSAAATLAAYQSLDAAVDSKTGMPTRVLCKTGARVSVLAFGSGSHVCLGATLELLCPCSASNPVPAVRQSTHRMMITG